MQSTAPQTLLMLGKGPSRKALPAMLAAYPGAILWTLNNYFPEGKDPEIPGFVIERETHLHFDVHHDQRFWKEFNEVRAGICSPFRVPPAPHVQPFPLELVFETFGHAYFESSFDYMVALALLRHVRGEQPLARICTPGACMLDPTHFAYRFGLHFWLGVARGLGIALEIPEPTAVLQRKTNARVCSTDDEFPHLYGQPWSVSEPHARHYGWHG